MPLQQGKSKRSFASNIRELMHAYRSKGKIGTSTPSSPAKANKQAVAIAYAQQRKGK